MSDKMLIPPITDADYKKIMSDLGMPESRSLLFALRQVANHAAQYALQQAAQSEQSVPVVGEVVDYDDDIKKRMRFYAVNDLISLSRIQSEHIARLQKKLPTMRDEQPRNPRSGGE